MKILVYHKINNKDLFEKQIHYLKSKFEIIDPSFLDDYFNKSKSIPENALMITFDDGDYSLFTNAFPVLKKANVPALIFVITNLIETMKPFWWEEIEHYLGPKEGNKKVWEVKNWPNKKRVDFLERLRIESTKGFLHIKQLQVAQLKEMQEAGIYIGNHSHTHPMFNNCSKVELEKELEASSEFLYNKDFSPEFFAYPNGNYSTLSEESLIKFKIKYAFLFDHKIDKGLNPLRISRLIVNDSTPIWKFKLILSGWHSHILPITRFLGKLTGK